MTLTGATDKLAPAARKGQVMLDRLSSAERLRLMKFVCSFAWADLEVRPEERRFVARLIDRLGLTPAEEIRVQG